MTRRRAPCLLLAAALAVGAAAAWGQRSALEPLAPPDLTGADPAVAAQLFEAHEAVAELAADPGVADADLADAYGQVGLLLMVYDLPASARVAFANAAALAPAERSWLYYLGVTQHQASRLEEAAASFERALALAPDDLPTLLRLGRVEMELGRLESAALRFARALEIDPGNAAALDGEGRLAILERDWARAADRLRAVVERQPEAATAHYQLGLALRELGELERARVHLARGGRQEVRFSDPLMEGLGSLARGSAIQVVRATRARARGDLEGAIAAFRAALAGEPGLESARLALASTLRQAGREEEALAELEEAVRRNPESAAALYNLGTLVGRRGEGPRAVELLRAATRRAPGFADAWVNLGGQLGALGRFDEAEAALATAVELDPADHPARLLHAESLARLGRWETALEEVEEVLRRQPESEAARAARLDLHLRSAVAAGREGRFDLAAERYRRALEQDPDLREAGYGRAVALLLARDYPAALEHLEASVSRWPGDAAMETALARLLAAAPDPALRDGERALALARRVVERQLTVEHAETVAMALAELERFDEAAAVLERAAVQAERLGDAGTAERLRSDRELYRAGSKVREPWLR